MRVSTKSWHYRLLDFYNFDKPQNLCPYFWKVVATVIFTPFILLGMGIVDIIVAYETRHKPKHKEYKPISETRRMTFRISLLIAFFIYGVLTMTYLNTKWYWAFSGFFVLCFFYGCAFIGRYLGKRDFEMETKKSKPKKPKEPNIALEYLKAKKHKYCPVITFVTPEMEDESWKKGLQ